MSVAILIPTPLRRYVGGARTVGVEASTVADALAELAVRSPDLRAQIFDDAGRVRTFVNVFLGDQDVRHIARAGEPIPVKDGDVITLVPAIAGGAIDSAADVRFSRDEILRYSRHLIMPEVTLEGQRRLKEARVLCVGAGGLGSPLALYLAAAGVGRLGVVDFDPVDLTNLQRQILYCTRDVGRPKLEAACERLAALNPHVEIVAARPRSTSDNAIGPHPRLRHRRGRDRQLPDPLPGQRRVRPDRQAQRLREHLPLRGSGLASSTPPRGPCYRCLFPEPPPPGLVPSCAEGGVLGVLPGIIGSLQALEVIKLILGAARPAHRASRALRRARFGFREVRVRKDPACAVCGTEPTITAPIDYEMFCGIRGEEGEVDATGVPILSVDELNARRSGGEAFELLDVRERYEIDIVRIPGSRAFPLSELPARMHELDSATTYTLSCHHGTRSVQAYHALRKAGFGRLQVLAGGVDAWAARIDPSLPRY